MELDEGELIVAVSFNKDGSLRYAVSNRGTVWSWSWNQWHKQ